MATGGLVAAAGAGYGARSMQTLLDERKGLNLPGEGHASESFWGVHQGGIVTSPQTHTYFAAFDLISDKRDDIIKLLQAWTEASAKMTKGESAAGDSGEVVGLYPARLTLTFGFGSGLFMKEGKDRYGLTSMRPAALVDMPQFNGDQLIAQKTGGDISVQACADDPQVAFHAIRQLARLAVNVAQIRWTQTGFISKPDGENTPRNLQGFKDGTQSPARERPKEDNPAAAKKNTKKGLDEVIWVGAEGPVWMQGGTYLAVRRIRMALEHWENTNVEFQEQVIGRHKISGAPLGGKDEFDALNLDATDKDGNLLIPDNAHVRLASAMTNDGAQILRRGYSYNDGVNFIAERWPPWRQGMEYDAGLLFLAYQRDPRTGFIKIFDKMAKFDALGQFVTHTGSGLFACPGGVREGEFIGEGLFGAT
jgi:deferrochelatase/peroxidase EfeB